LITCDTVIGDTPAAFATSCIVTTLESYAGSVDSNATVRQSVVGPVAADLSVKRSNPDAPEMSDASPSPSVSQPAAGGRRPAAGGTIGTRVVLRLSDGTATATLADTAAARKFAALLPVQLALRDPTGQAKSGRLPAPLTVADADRILDPELAGLYYWPPSGDVGIVYDDLGQTLPPPGMVQLGTVISGLPRIAPAGNRFTVAIERAWHRCAYPQA
jgi:hypothetical protein